MKAANSVSNMTLAHEIAVDNNFHLKKVEPPNGGGYVFTMFTCCIKN